MTHIDRTRAAGVQNEFQGAFDTHARPDQELQINYQNADGSGGIVVISYGTKHYKALAEGIKQSLCAPS
jgi:hypothetical protein